MRLLKDAERKQLLDRICAYTRSNTGFKVSKCDLHFQVIPGETEGLYGWIATNYLLGGFDAPEDHVHGDGHHTYGFLDMGGASAQIAFAPNSTEAQRHANDLKLVRFRKVNGRPDEYRVFVTTWLEFGVHEARRRYLDSLKDKFGSVQELPDPCLPKGLKVGAVEGKILAPEEVDGKEPHLIGTADFGECLRATFPLLNKDKRCDDAPCLLNGVHVPAIDFGVNHFVGVSEYWHTTHEIFEFAHKDKSYDWQTYQERVNEFCNQDWSKIAKSVEAKKYGKKVTEITAAEVCFKASWLINMLHDGIGIPRVGLEDMPDGTNGTKQVLESARNKGYTDAFQAVNKIDDTEVSWTLGKMVLYASSEVEPLKTNSYPVGFGSNTNGVPDDFQFAGFYHPPRPNGTQFEEPDTDSSGDGWRETLFNGKTPRRVPGFILFVLMLCIAALLLCGKDRRSRFFHRFYPFLPRRFTRRGRGMFQSKPPFLSSSALHSSMDAQQRQGLLESGGLADPNDFELGSVDAGADEDIYSDDSGSIHKGRTSGWGTPRLRVGTPKLDGSFGGSSSSDSIPHSHHGPRASGSSGSDNSGHGNGLDRTGSSGLFIRTESRESLRDMLPGLVLEPQRRSRSRRSSPNRKGLPGRSPLVGGSSSLED